MKLAGLCLSISLVVAFLVTTVSAQDTGVLTGTVRDDSSAVIRNAKVKVRSETGNLNSDTVTNTDGEYSVPDLPNGVYDLTISADGFRTFEAKGVVLRVAQKARVDAILTVGQISETVVVQGEGLAQVETQASEVASTLTGTQISKLPMNGRVFVSLVGLMPGVSDNTEGDELQTGSFSGVNTAINGGRPEYNNWQVNGGDNQDTGSNGTLVVYPSVEAIGEVRILESSYGAQYGKNGQGTIEIETKSGTNKFHGDLYYFGRNDALNARSFFADPTQPKPSYKRHDFGYTIGGPVYIPGHYNTDKSKTFFFWSQEWRRQIDPTDYFAQVPSDAERGGDFTDQCPNSDPAIGFAACPNTTLYPTHQVPVDPNSALLVPLIPHANLFPLGGSTGNIQIPTFSKSVSLPTRTREEVLDIDHNVTSKVRASFRYIHDSYFQEEPFTGWGSSSTYPTFGSTRNGPGISMVARVTAAILPTLYNEFIMGYTSNQLVFSDTGPVQRSVYPGLFTNGLFTNGFGGKVSAVSVSDSNTGLGFTVDPAFSFENTNPTYSYRDNISKIIGKHSLQFGAYFQASQKQEPTGLSLEGTLNFNNNGSTVTTGNGFADFLTGNMASFSQNSADFRYHQRYKILEPYFQDDWRATPKLTLNLGLRISLFGTQREIGKRVANFDPRAFMTSAVPAIVQAAGPNQGAFDPIATPNANPFTGLVQCGGPGGNVAGFVSGSPFPNAALGGTSYPGCAKGHLFNPAPRIGFAYDPTGKGKMSIRGGYGIFWEHTNGVEANTGGLEGSAPYVLNSTQFNIAGYANIGGGVSANAPPLFPISPVSIPTQVDWPYVQQWHLDVQKEIPGKTVVVVAYVGSKGTHLTTQTDGNEVPYFGDLGQPNPFGPGQTLSSTNACAPVSQTTPYLPGQVVPGTTLPLTQATASNLNIACGNSPTTAGYRPFSGYGSIFKFTESANSSYNSLQVTARRTAGRLTYSVAYTYSHSIDDASGRADSGILDGYFPQRARASSNFDQRHILNLSYFYELPFFAKPGVAHALLGGWALSGITLLQTGQPYSVVFGNDNAGVANGDGQGSLLDLVGDPHAAPAIKQIGGRPVLFNTAAYAMPQALTFGDSGRNSLNLPFRTNFDIGLFKSFPIREGKSFEFRLEGFNIFNHPQFNSVDTTLGDAFFGTPNGGHAARIMQYSLKFIF